MVRVVGNVYQIVVLRVFDICASILCRLLYIKLQCIGYTNISEVSVQYPTNYKSQ